MTSAKEQTFKKFKFDMKDDSGANNDFASDA